MVKKSIEQGKQADFADVDRDSRSISAGFDFAAQEENTLSLDLNRYLVNNPFSTYYLRVDSDSMAGYGIYLDDVVVVDRSLQPVDQSIVIVNDEQKLMIRVVACQQVNGRELMHLQSDSDDNCGVLRFDRTDGYDPCALYFWGVVVGMVRKLRRGK